MPTLIDANTAHLMNECEHRALDNEKYEHNSEIFIPAIKTERMVG